MHNYRKMSDWTEDAISNWTEMGIKLQKGIPLQKITEYEILLDFKFPDDFIELYIKVDGFEDDWNDDMFCLWPLQRIVKEYLHNADANYIPFCDFLINSHTIGFLKSDTGIHKSYEQPQVIAATFRDFILLLNLNDDLLY